MEKEKTKNNVISLEEDFKRVVEDNEKLQEENKELQQRIDKAIEYIEGHIIEDSEYENYMQCEREEKEELLNILKGSEE
jgi:regulator of replication initiation timing